MNKSDFISDAVALDLGKSGVKVAETIEMQIGDEWWRLINSAEIHTAQTYTKRRAKPSPYTPGTLDLSGLKVASDTGLYGHNSQGIRSNGMLPKLARTADGDEWVMLQMIPTGANQKMKVSFRNLTTGVSTTVESSFTGHSWGATPYGAWWDSAIQAFCVVLASVYNTSTMYQTHICMYINKSGAKISEAEIARNVPLRVVVDMGTFPETTDGAIYSLFWNPTTSPPWIRKTIPQAGANSANALSVINDSKTGATVLSAITTANSANRMSIFYSRAYESVGVAWRNSETKYLQYVLEKDSWAVVYTMPELDTSEYIFSGLSNLVIPNEGEFLVSDWLTYKVGNLILPTGFTFPTNLILFGATPVEGRQAILWGSVGNTMYAYSLDYDARTITPLGVDGTVTGTGFSGTLNWQYGHKQPTVLYETETRLLLMFRAEDPVIMLYDRENNAILWYWAGWTDSTAFPKTYSSTSSSPRGGTLYVLGDNLFFFNHTHGFSVASRSTMETASVPIADVMNCVDGTALTNLIVANRYLILNVYTSLQDLGASLWYTNRQPVCSSQNPESCKMVAEDNNYYYLHLSVLNKNIYPSNPLTQSAFPGSGDSSLDGAYSSIDTTVYISKTTMRPVGYYRGGASANTRDAISSFGIDEDQKHRYLNTMLEADESEAHIKRFNGAGVSFKNYLNNTMSGTVTSGGITTTIYSAPQGSTSACPINKKGEALFYGIQSNYIAQYGAKINSTGVVGGFTSSLHSLPFTPSMLMLDEWEDFGIALGQIVDNNVPYCIFNAKTGFHNKIMAVKVADLSVSEVVLPTADSGGVGALRMFGSYGYITTATGELQRIDTFLPLDYGVGSEPPEQYAPIIYDYEERVYIPYPFAREGIKVELSNISKTTKVTIPETQSDLIRTMIASGTDFRGSRCILRRLFPDHVNLGSDMILLDGYVQDWSYAPDKKGILFTVSKTLIDVGATFPKRLMNMGCSHVFCGVRCGYIGADGICTKTKTDCTAKGSVANFGGFPWVAARQRRVMWR